MRITKETQAQLGTYSDVQTLSLTQGEARVLPYQFTLNGTPIDITNYTFEFEIIERSVDYITDTKNGINIVGLTAKPGANAIVLTGNITVTDALNGNVQVYIPATVTAVEPSDPDSVTPIVYTGFFSINNGATPTAEIQKLQYLILVSNDGV